MSFRWDLVTPDQLGSLLAGMEVADALADTRAARGRPMIGGRRPRRCGSLKADVRVDGKVTKALHRWDQPNLLDQDGGYRTRGRR
jgi:hypothetical protein